ncbi:MAG: type II toxin-antitoxin system RelE/ParE family toxin [Silvibacterium sp.]
MKVLWTEPAFKQWEESFEYIEAENAAAAYRIAERIVEAIEMLAAHPYAGRVGRIAGMREFAVPRSPFIIAYQADQLAGILWVLAVYDGRRRWPKTFPRE